MPAVHMSGQHNLTFVHIPKSAGTSVGNWMVDHAGDSDVKLWWGHPPLSSIRRTHGVNYTIAVVRNPWDRLVSAYYYAQFGTSPVPALDSEMIHEMFIKANKYSKWPSFEQWIETLPQFYTTFNTQGMILPQTWWIGDNADLVIKMEELSSEFVKIQELFGSNDPLPKENTTVHGQYKEYYNDRTRDMVAQWFKKDIERWHYEF